MTIFVNQGSGPKATEPDELLELFPGEHVVEIDVDKFAEQVVEAAQAGEPIIVAGGDGTISCAAAAIVDIDATLAAVPAGTRNHFAKDLGIPDLETAAAAVASGHTVVVDLAEVNDRPFINNATVGLYPNLVTTRDHRWRRLPKGPATVLALLVQLRRTRPFSVEVAGESWKAWMVFVGNGPYGDGLLDTIGRESLTEGTLDILVVRADGVLALPRVVLAFALGRLAASPLVERHRAEKARIVLRRKEVRVAVDGEVMHMATPLECRSLPGALRVAVPPPSED